MGLPCSKVLSNKCCCRESERLHRHKEKRVYLCICGIACHTFFAKEVDIRLNKYIGEGGYCHLERCGDSDLDNLFEYREDFLKASLRDNEKEADLWRNFSLPLNDLKKSF